MDTSFKAFFPTAAVIEEERVISKRFRDEKGELIPFKAKAIDEATNSRLRKAAVKVEKKRGQRYEYSDQPQYMTRLILECVTFPNLNDDQLQNAYGVMTAADLIRKMLLPGEYSELVLWITELNGFDEDLNEAVEEAKN